MKIIKFLFSGAFMGILLIVFAYAIGYATFVENDYGAIAAKVLVYNATWFEILLFLMVVNFTGMIFTKHLYLRSKWNILAIHIALIIIIIGAGITRYIGYEGSMHIRDGQTSNEMQTSDTFLQVQVGEGDEAEYLNKSIFLTMARNKLAKESVNWKGNKFNITVEDYYNLAAQTVVPDNNGGPIITVQFRSPSGQTEVNLKYGETTEFENIKLAFTDLAGEDYTQIKLINNQMYIRNIFSEEELIAMDTIEFIEEDLVPIKKMQVFFAGNAAFRVSNFQTRAVLKFKPLSNPEMPGVPIVKVKVNNQERYIKTNSTTRFDFAGIPVDVRVGNRTILLPFALKLDKFDLERYPGSNSPSSYASDVTVIDKNNNKEFPYRIYMNNVLDYGGYRFFQSSYDLDEKGTVLSVNHDYWGTLVTYTGYFLLFASLIFSLFTKTRFFRVKQMLKDVHARRKKLLSKTATVVLVLLTSTLAFAQPPVANKEHAEKFGQLLVQSKGGRIEPVNTLATKMLVKISKKASYKGLTADQVLLGMLTNPNNWRVTPIIKVGETEIQERIGISGDYAAFEDFIGPNETYKIGQPVEQAYQKKPASRSTLDKGMINVDERMNVTYSILSGSSFRIFPLENDPNNTWVTPQEYHSKLGHGNSTADIFENYTKALNAAIASGDYTEADKFLDQINQMQQTIGADVVPSKTKTKIEIIYNKLNIFKNLFPVYMVLGILLVGIFLIQIFYPNMEFKVLGKILLVIMVIAFALQTLGLGARWYISGHAPWSNGYESMIYISWATVLAGFIFRKSSNVTLGVTALLAGITLLTAHMSWLNPEVTNLVPVLKSHWLTIHVATITASYGFLALGCMIGFLNLCIMIFRNEKNKDMVNLTLKELMLITEMSLAIGLILLVIGNFLGGIWANESWGRYWGWDPKETWTLVTIILYAFTLHLTLIPSIRNAFTFSFFSFISFGAVMMTYFGVNYYLSGLHSYANGDPVAIPVGLYYALGVIAIISILAAYNEFKFSESED